MKVVTAEVMREMDRRAIEEFGIPGVVLMENAGRAVVEVIQREYGPLRGKRIAVYCGAGNNGGDGFVIARYLSLAGANPYAILVGNMEALKADARVHYDLMRQCGINRYVVDNPPSYQTSIVIEKRDEHSRQYRVNDWDTIDYDAIDQDKLFLIVDALLGTGMKDGLRSPYAEAIQAINDSSGGSEKVPVIAVDIPSGVYADTGAVAGAVWASHTVTFGYPKQGHFLFPGVKYVGKLHVADIGFPWSVLDAEEHYYGVYWFRGMGWQADLWLKRREPDTNKGDYGHVGIIAGSRGMAGAPALAARAAQRAGAGLVTVLAPACVQPMIAAKLDEQMTIPLPDEDGALSEAAFDVIANFAKKASVLCIGPGLTTAPQTVALVHRLIAEIEKPIVLDADGLNALAQKPEVALQIGRDPYYCPLILTPHPGEAARLLETSIDAIQSNRIEAVRELARKFRAVALLKGRYTLTANIGGWVAITTTGNPGMATGGSGDTLTGILGGLIAQMDFKSYTDSHETVAFGALLHGMAGDIAAAKFGETALTAGDITACLPEAFRMLEETE